MAEDAGIMDLLGGGGDAGGGRSAAGPNETARKKKMRQAIAGGLSGAAQGGGEGMSIAPIPQPAQMQAAQSSFQMPQNIIGDARYEALSRLAR
jgi:hypothetical protein